MLINGTHSDICILIIIIHGNNNNNNNNNNIDGCMNKCNATGWLFPKVVVVVCLQVPIGPVV